MESTFLTAEWRKLIMANYAVDPLILEPYLPANTELDFWNGRCYVSLVGFLFKDTRLKGVRVPFHHTFEEVNLRFYVRYNDNGTWKRGTVFIKEIVPKAAITWVANTIYKEKYVTMPMRHAWEQNGKELSVSYHWKLQRWFTLQVVTNLTPQPIAVGSEAEFITEHYWGYTRGADGHTSEYGVEHPRWEVYATKSYEIDADFGALYGNAFQSLNAATPDSMFLAEGSAIAVKSKKLL